MKKTFTAIATAAAFMGTAMFGPSQASAAGWVVIPLAIVGTVVVGTAVAKATQPPQGTITVKPTKKPKRR